VAFILKGGKEARKESKEPGGKVKCDSNIDPEAVPEQDGKPGKGSGWREG